MTPEEIAALTTDCAKTCGIRLPKPKINPDKSVTIDGGWNLKYEERTKSLLMRHGLTGNVEVPATGEWTARRAVSYMVIQLVQNRAFVWRDSAPKKAQA